MLHQSYEFYKNLFLSRRLPLAFVDLDQLDINASALQERAAGMPMRIATKSIRSVAIIKYILDRFPGFRGVMAYSPAEACYLVEQGIDDILIGYPSVEASELTPCLNHVKAGKQITFMVDHHRHVEILGALATQIGTKAPLCLDIDLSTVFPGLHFGVYRSPITCADDAQPLIKRIHTTAGVRLIGVMGYEAQLAGVADAVPGAPLKNMIIKLLKWYARRECFPRRRQLVDELGRQGFDLKFVNGGGTGSIELTKLDTSVTELTVGSGLYAPGLFDHYAQFRHQPAAGFALPVVRIARPGIYACSGGGYIASGPTSEDKQPTPILPKGTRLIKLLGAGEVQTSLRSSVPLQIGDPVIFRHAKAGELCERFNHLSLVRGDRIEAEVSTYRGDGQCFC
ncbi:MAG: amino acid deaminase/aldolase [Deltaproteobacteria bacterium]|nr:amino acid deaminase/aldolase [Deltaproteobacteria bacterium]